MNQFLWTTTRIVASQMAQQSLCMLAYSGRASCSGVALARPIKNVRVITYKRMCSRARASIDLRSSAQNSNHSSRLRYICVHREMISNDIQFYPMPSIGERLGPNFWRSQNGNGHRREQMRHSFHSFASPSIFGPLFHLACRLDWTREFASELFELAVASARRRGVVLPLEPGPKLCQH